MYIIKFPCNRFRQFFKYLGREFKRDTNFRIIYLSRPDKLGYSESEVKKLYTLQFTQQPITSFF